VKRLRILVVTPVFSLAGVPLAQIRFARALARRGHEVELVIGNIDQSHPFPSAPEIKVTHLRKTNARAMLLPMIKLFKETKPDVVFSAEDHLNAFVLLAAILSGTKAKISGSSRVTPFDTYPKRLFSKGTVLKQLMKAVMYRADALTCVSKDMVEQYRTIFDQAPHVDVYNIVDDASSRQRMMDPVDEPWLLMDDGVPVLVAAGRLGSWKGFDTLIDAMKQLLKVRKARLLILGDGPCRADLERQIEVNGLTDWIKLPGYVENPLKYYRNADVFVLSSRVEGLPNVLVEAMLCGCTPVATDCPTGPREVLQDGKYGYLVPVDDPVKMAVAIGEAIDFPISEELLAEAIKPFAEDAVIDRHFEILGLHSIHRELVE
jgi:glycosyltransferase involved in cell wall biosynthesis